jgi:hypothetical protein
MLAEKFFLFLETLMSHAADGGPVVVSSAPHIPVSCAVQETGISPGEKVRCPMP